MIVVGGGNAALCAALAARREGARVLLLERAPESMRGGNTRHTRNIRCAHADGDPYLSGEYAEEEFLEDLAGVTGGPTNPDLARFTIRESRSLPGWMTEHGVRWQQPLAGTLHLGRTNRFFLGGGKALVNAYYETARRMGVDVRCEACVDDLIIEDGCFRAVALGRGPSREVVPGRAVVVAAGGFEANLEWLKRYWGEAAGNFVVRGTPYNDGTVLAALLARGAMQVGDPRGLHAIAVDARAPRYDGGIVTRLDAIPFGIVVNRLGRRFYDEGEDLWPKRYAIWGRLIAEQPGQVAYCILDAKTIDCFLPPMYKPYRADALEPLAAELELDPGALAETVRTYNRATTGNTHFRLDLLDGTRTRDLTPPKSNWALPIDRPPFYGLPLRPGITFTYLGVAVDATARVLDRSGRPLQNVYAAGEIMAGNILSRGYLGGFGLTIGTVFGRVGGREAAKAAMYARA
ncbi:MAG TPA: FAD-dependent tricarballylate dehydrogenase TcuA [bacterium]|nr:FAD-dependent tricarballylate dehydrogenase TcuA [bacterium]